MIYQYPLTIYFDASCRLCNAEMTNLKAHDSEDRFVIIDVSAPEFDDSAFRQQGITRELMMNRLHVQDTEGVWLIGVDAFEVLYRTVGIESIAALWGSPLTKPLAKRLYPWIARNRYLLSAIGLSAVFGLWSRQAAKRADKISQTCAEGLCSKINE